LFQQRYLSRHPKAALYAGFADFSFWLMDVHRAYLNGGFGKAFTLTAEDLSTPLDAVSGLEEMEPGAIAHMAADHSDAVQRYAARAGASGPGWRLACLDPEGLDLAKDDQMARLWFDVPLASADSLRSALVALGRSSVSEG
jgi:putative heme iron utilization protein